MKKQNWKAGRVVDAIDHIQIEFDSKVTNTVSVEVFSFEEAQELLIQLHKVLLQRVGKVKIT